MLVDMRVVKQPGAPCRAPGTRVLLAKQSCTHAGFPFDNRRFVSLGKRASKAGIMAN